MTVQGMDDVGIVVEDLAAATAFFFELGLELVGEAEVSGRWVDRVVGLEGVRSEIAMVATPDGRSRPELMNDHSPAVRPGDADAPANTLGVVTYEDSHRPCDVRGPEGIIVMLAEPLR